MEKIAVTFGLDIFDLARTAIFNEDQDAFIELLRNHIEEKYQSLISVSKRFKEQADNLQKAFDQIKKERGVGIKLEKESSDSGTKRTSDSIDDWNNEEQSSSQSLGGNAKRPRIDKAK